MTKIKDSGIEWIGDIPNDWYLERLQGCLKEIKEINKPEKTKQILSLTNTRGVIPYEEKGAQGNNAKEDCTQYKLAYPETIVANSMNILIGSVGKCDYFGCVSPVYYVFKPKEKTNIDFINYIFQTQQFQKELRKYANGILEIRLRVSSDNILKRYVAIPSYEKQMKIVETIKEKEEKINQLIANQEKQIEKLKAYKESEITRIVVKGLNPEVNIKNSGVEWIGDIPKDWEVLKIKNLGATQNGISKSSEYFGHGFPFVSYGDVYKNYSLPVKVEGLIDSTENDRQIFSVQEGDIFFTRTSETIDEVGFSSVCEKTLENACFAGFLIRFRPFDVNSKLHTSYAKYYFRSNLTRRYLVKEMNLVTRASLSQDLLKSMFVLLPPLEEQKEIANYLDKMCSLIDELIDVKQGKIKELKRYKQILIYEYVTGKKEVI